MKTHFARIIKHLRRHFPEADLGIVELAYHEAAKAHQGQTRLSGEPYVSHCLAVGRILASLGLDPTTVSAGLLHDVIEDTRVTREELLLVFGEEIAALVDGVTKISALHMASSTSREDEQAENLRKMLVATAQDVRVILIKLADRLHNMRTIEFLPADKIRRIARETQEIYAPLALRLGISQWRWELEDHAFHHLNPEQYRRMVALVAMKRREREADLAEAVAFLERRLAKAELPARVTGRPKHLYSIYQKMVRQGKDFEEVLDLQGARIITQTTEQCYNALGIIHDMWTPIPGRFKDYIGLPKQNMYQSIHTVVMRGNGRPLEVQIRTEDMDRTAREGIAAHWRYKEGTEEADPQEERWMSWLRQMYEWVKEDHPSTDFLDNVRRFFTATGVYVFTPKGEVKELPAGATPLDFAYHIHTDVGYHCIGARVNGRMVPIRYHLQTGEVVEILTSKNQTPHQDWVDLVVTARARTRIRQALRDLGKLEPADLPKPRPAVPERIEKPEVREVDAATREKLLRVEGMGRTAAQFAKCCAPMPGQAIVGYATRNAGITVHRADCPNFRVTQRDPGRIIQVSWEGEGHFEGEVRVTVKRRPHVLNDILSAMRFMNIDVVGSNGPTGENEYVLAVVASDRGFVQRAERTLPTVPGVVAVRVVSLRELAGTA